MKFFSFIACDGRETGKLGWIFLLSSGDRCRLKLTRYTFHGI